MNVMCHHMKPVSQGWHAKKCQQCSTGFPCPVMCFACLESCQQICPAGQEVCQGICRRNLCGSIAFYCKEIVSNLAQVFIWITLLGYFFGETWSLQSTDKLPFVPLNWFLAALVRDRTLFKVHADFVEAAVRGSLAVVNRQIGAFPLIAPWPPCLQAPCLNTQWKTLVRSLRKLYEAIRKLLLNFFYLYPISNKRMVKNASFLCCWHA